MAKGNGHLGDTVVRFLKRIDGADSSSSLSAIVKDAVSAIKTNSDRVSSHQLYTAVSHISGTAANRYAELKGCTVTYGISNTRHVSNGQGHLDPSEVAALNRETYKKITRPAEQFLKNIYR